MTSFGVSSVLEVFRAPRLSYAEGLEIQEAWVSRRRAGEIPDRLLLLEHPHVVTRGRGTRPEHLLRTPEELARMGVELHDAGRGGDITYHGPGQLVGYPVLDLKPGPGREDRRDLHRYLRDLEAVIIDTLATLGVDGTRAPGLTGVWTEQGKVAALGVRVSSGWITSHGFALNLRTDLDYFGTIVPCGIQDRGVTSLERLLAGSSGRGEEVGAHGTRERTDMPERRKVEDLLISHFSRHFSPPGGWRVEERGHPSVSG